MASKNTRTALIAALVLSAAAAPAGPALVSGKARADEAAGAGEAIIDADPTGAATPAEVVEVSDEMFPAVLAVDGQKLSGMPGKAVSRPELDRIAQGWEKTGVGFGGATCPFESTHMEYTLRPLQHIENTPDCDRLMAKIRIDTSIEGITSRAVPGGDAKCNPPLPFSRPVCPSGAE